ncbi:MAG: CPBP family intramembrane metalloprotease [Planctomycetia bacterium]|nr:CPBP family intramembrane metalloprotease [Planctomycetia bacterium]
MNEASNSESLTTPPTARTAGRRAMAFEMAAVLCLIAALPLGYAVCRLSWGDEYRQLCDQRSYLGYYTPVGFDSNEVQRTFYTLQCIPIILFVMWRSGDGWSHFGIVKPAYEKDIAIGLGLSLAIVGLKCLVHVASNGWYPIPTFLANPVPWRRAVLILADCCAVGFSQELFGRAYLIPRLEAMTGTTVKAVVLSVLLFGFLHLYQGLDGVTGSLIAATVWGIAFCLTRRVWPVAISHALTDFVIITHLGAMAGS